MLEVRPDPRKEFAEEEARARNALYEEHMAVVEKSTEAADRLRETRETIRKLKGFSERIEKDSVRKEFVKKSDELLKGIEEQMKEFEGVDREGIYRDPDLLISQLRRASYFLRSSDGKPAETHRKLHRRAVEKAHRVIDDVNEFHSSPQWTDYKELVRESGLSFFGKEKEPIEGPERTDDE
jgi:hypothetical protein